MNHEEHEVVFQLVRPGEEAQESDSWASSFGDLKGGGIWIRVYELWGGGTGKFGAKRKPVIAWETITGFRGGEGRNFVSLEPWGARLADRKS
jgi:hypothetical protein